MGTLPLTDDLRAEYERLYAEVDIPEGRESEVAEAAQKALAGWPRYETVAAALNIPPHPVALIHALESGCDFTRHLHNGDPLTARTVHVPAGRPVTGEPPYTWEASALDALRQHGLDKWSDWSVAGLCYVLERYNGWGYRKYHPMTKSPYLWSFTSIYTAGKYVADGKWSGTAISQQVGAVALLMEIIKQGHPYPTQEVAHAKAPSDVASTSTKPGASVLPTVPMDVQEQGPNLGSTMGAPVSAFSQLTSVLKALVASKTMGGVAGLVLLQFMGQAPWDIRLWVGGHIYDIPNLSSYFSLAFGALATWGRITAKPIEGGARA